MPPAPEGSVTEVVGTTETMDGLPGPSEQLGDPELEPVEELPPLPVDYVRPTLDEFVAAGYSADVYDAHMAKVEVGIRRRLAEEAAAVAALEGDESDPADDEGDGSDLLDDVSEDEGRRAPEQTPGHEPDPFDPAPIIMATATRAHHVLCRVVGPGSVRYERTTYPEGSLAEFAETDADTMPQLERI